MIVRKCLFTIIATSGLLLGGCEGVKEQLGLGKSAPDEFTVVKKAPLTIPPDFALRPPAPGTRRPQEQPPEIQARRALIGNSRSVDIESLDRSGVNEERSTGELVVLERAGAGESDPGIRTLVDREANQIIEDSRSLTDAIIFWQEDPPPGTLVDAGKEAKRLRENAAVNAPVTDGDTPIIERREKGLLEGIF